MDGNTLGERLRAARGEHRAIEDIAHEYRKMYGKERGVSRTTISRWENDEGRPPAWVLARLAQVLDVPLIELDPDIHAELLVLANVGGAATSEQGKSASSWMAITAGQAA